MINMVIAFLLGFVCVVVCITLLQRRCVPYSEILGLIIGIIVATIIAMNTIDQGYLNA